MPHGEACAAALVPRIRHGRCIATLHSRGEGIRRDRSAPAAVAVGFEIPVPSIHWQPVLDLDIGIAGWFGGHLHAAERRKVPEQVAASGFSRSLALCTSRGRERSGSHGLREDRRMRNRKRIQAFTGRAHRIGGHARPNNDECSVFQHGYGLLVPGYR